MGSRGPIGPMTRTGLIVRLLVTAVVLVLLVRVVVGSMHAQPPH